jgi:D-glycero-D-manno-heptose 1,7-bisphosphate phosphatase
LNVSLQGVPVVGDSLRDLESALAVDALPILVRTGRGRETEALLPDALSGIPVFDDLLCFVDALAEDSEC